MKNVILSLFLVISSLASAQISQTEKQALLDLYEATQGAQWNKTWDLNKDVTTWHGIKLKDNHVISISLLFNNLEGTIPQSISNLSQLENLELSFNKLEGTIPTEITQLTKLKILALNGNNLSGSLPTTFNTMVALEELHLSSNSFTGTLPFSLTTLSKLRIVNVFDNQLTGLIPVSFQELKKLEQLVIAENDLLIPNDVKGIVFFEEDIETKPTSLVPSAKSVIAIETPEDN